MHPISMSGFMEIYKVDRTFRAQSPDDIDPGRTKPNVPWAWRVSDDVGCANPIVGRVFIQCVEALEMNELSRGSVEKIKVSLHTCKEDLRNCEKAFLRLAREYDRISADIRGAGGVRVERRVVNDLPQIPDLEHDATVFLTSAKRALQSIAEVLNEFYGVDIKNARFDKGHTQLKKMQPVPSKLVATLERFAPTIERVLHLRNFQDHTPKKTIVDNFTISATELLSPTWRVDPESAVPMIPEMQRLISEIIELTEASFFIGLIDNLKVVSGPFCYVIVEIPDAHREGAALRYRCEMQFAPPISD